ncbi:hypothetical protein [Streptomyces platensis]|uniref:hypothetical protein n=1 Tax=Streptomyces platensis TaxID=58346 RepID=UPI003870C265|nr:hypothetical protein OG962_04655 [Streptomyces platensis]
MAPRVPEDPQLVLTATEDTLTRRYGSGEPPTVTVRGPLGDLTAWLTGRRPQQPLGCRLSGAVAPLPELLGWP